MRHHLKGYLAGLSILVGENEKPEVLSCLHQCKESLQVNLVIKIYDISIISNLHQITNFDSDQNITYFFVTELEVYFTCQNGKYKVHILGIGIKLITIKNNIIVYQPQLFDFIISNNTS